MALSVITSTIALSTAGTLGVLAHGAFHPRARLFGPVVWRGSGARAEVALTFDDGPDPGVTDRILDALDRAEARATFFVIGRAALAHPELLRRIHAEGHLIGNHTLDHHWFGLFRRDAYWRRQIDQCAAVVEELVGVRPRYFRPPMGFTSAHVRRAVRAGGCTSVTWSRRGLDTLIRSPEHIARRVLAGIAPGEIVALHDGIDRADRAQCRSRPLATAEALPIILEGLRERGLRPVRLDELLAPALHDQGVLREPLLERAVTEAEPAIA